MKKFWIVLGIVLLIAVSAGAGALVTYTKLNLIFAEQLTEIYDSKVTSKTAEVQEYLDTYFVGEADDAVLADAAASAMVDAIQDEWSYYIPADSYDLYLEQMYNEYVGIGVIITQTAEMDTLIRCLMRSLPWTVNLWTVLISTRCVIWCAGKAEPS